VRWSLPAVMGRAVVVADSRSERGRTSGKQGVAATEYRAGYASGGGANRRVALAVGHAGATGEHNDQGEDEWRT
jgi:hypothetical protein